MKSTRLVDDKIFIQANQDKTEILKLLSSSLDQPVTKNQPITISVFTFTSPVARGGGSGGASAPQFLADQLTLYQPGGHIIPTQYYKPPGFSDLATALHLRYCSNPKEKRQ